MEQDYLSLCDIQFDAAFDQIEGLARYPWVGSKFANSDCRPLILGDSHYAVNDDGSPSEEELERFRDKGYSRVIFENVIKDKCKSESTWPMYEGLLKTFMDVSPEKVKAFWSKIAFYNFIQCVMKRKDEVPSDDDKRKGWRCLAGVIKVLKPTSVLIVGVRNDGGSDSINNDSVKLEDFKDDKENKVNRCAPRIGRILTSETIIPLTLIQHTSQRYSPDKWREYLEKRDPQMMAYLSE